MKKLGLLLLSFLTLINTGYCNTIGWELTKSVNDGYLFELPVNFDVRTQLPFLPGAFLKTTAAFTAPRGDFVNSMKSFNHAYFDMEIGGGFTLLGWRISYATGGRNWWAGNDMGVPEGIAFNNSISGVLDW